jgi:Hint domain
MTTHLNTNLLLNPDAEAGGGSVDGNFVETIPDWTTGGNFTVVEYGGTGGFPTAAQAAPIDGGSNFFAGGPNSSTSSASQIVSFSDLASSINAGGIAATLSGYLGGYLNQDDQMALTVTWYDSLADVLGSFTLPIINAAARGDTMSLQYVSGTVVVPVGAVSAKVEMDATRYSGSYNDGYADNLSLSFSAIPAVSPYGTNLLLNSGAEAGSGSPTGNDIESIPDWTTTGAFTVMQYGAAIAPTTAQATPIGGGSNLFAGGPNTALSTATQTVLFSGISSDIAAGYVTATLSAYVGGYSSLSDHMAISATWLDQNGDSLGSFALPTVSDAARDEGTLLDYVTDTVTVPVGAVSARIEMDADGSGSNSYDHAYADNVSFVLLACYRRGTMIATSDGEVPIEELEIGEPVMTHDGTARPIKWIGRRAYDGRFVANNRSVLPIRIAANAIADGVPHQDLDVSPKHAMLIDGVLVPAELLVNDVSIWQLDAVEEVAYFHIELESHDTILAEGAPSETFVDCDNRNMFQNAEEYARLYPSDERRSWQFCAERLSEGAPKLRAIRKRLAQRAGIMDPRLRGGDECTRSKRLARTLAVQQVLRRYRDSAFATQGSMQPVAARR